MGERSKGEGSSTEGFFSFQLDLQSDSFCIGGRELHRGVLLEEIKNEPFSENAKEVPDLLDKDCLHLMLRHTVNYIGEEWVASLIFRNGEFQDLWLEHARLFTQKSLLKDAKSNPRLRKERASLYSKLKKRLIEKTGETGEQITNGGNLFYTWEFSSHGAMLVQDNNIPAVVISVQYFDSAKMGTGES